MISIRHSLELVLLFGTLLVCLEIEVLSFPVVKIVSMSNFFSLSEAFRVYDYHWKTLLSGDGARRRQAAPLDISPEFLDRLQVQVGQGRSTMDNFLVRASGCLKPLVRHLRSLHRMRQSRSKFNSTANAVDDSSHSNNSFLHVKLVTYNRSFDFVSCSK